MPGQCRAFDACRVRLDPSQRFEPLGILGQRLGQHAGFTAGDPSVELREEGTGLVDRLAFEHLGHQRGRRRRDRTAAALERDVGNPVSAERQIDGYPIATQRVVPMSKMGGLLDLAKVARVAPVIENDVLVELAQIHHRRNISRAVSIASANRSMSRSSL